MPYNWRAPCSPEALGRWKIQFCQALSRPNILLSMVSGPPKRKLASMPVKASGEKLARSSKAKRTSSSQSMSSGMKVTNPRSRAAWASKSLPLCSPMASMASFFGIPDAGKRVSMGFALYFFLVFRFSKFSHIYFVGGPINPDFGMNVSRKMHYTIIFGTSISI